MTLMKLKVPLVKISNWGDWRDKGKLEVCGDFDILSEGYLALRQQLNELIEQAKGDVKLLTDLHELSEKVSEAQTKLKNLEREIELAERYKKRLFAFLGRLGIDPTRYTSELTIGNQPILEGQVQECDGEAQEYDEEDGDEDEP